jgi:hypothetical protein
MKPVSLADISYEQGLVLLSLRKQAMDSGEINRMPPAAIANTYMLTPAVEPGFNKSAFLGMKPHQRNALLATAGGALLGGAGGALTTDPEKKKNRWRNALIGALSGGALGGGISLMASPQLQKDIAGPAEKGLSYLKGMVPNLSGNKDDIPLAEFRTNLQALPSGEAKVKYLNENPGLRNQLIERNQELGGDLKQRFMANLSNPELVDEALVGLGGTGSYVLGSKVGAKPTLKPQLKREDVRGFIEGEAKLPEPPKPSPVNTGELASAIKNKATVADPRTLENMAEVIDPKNKPSAPTLEDQVAKSTGIDRGAPDARQMWLDSLPNSIKKLPPEAIVAAIREKYPNLPREQVSRMLSGFGIDDLTINRVVPPVEPAAKLTPLQGRNKLRGYTIDDELKQLIPDEFDIEGNVSRIAEATGKPPAEVRKELAALIKAEANTPGSVWRDRGSKGLRGLGMLGIAYGVLPTLYRIMRGGSMGGSTDEAIRRSIGQ